MFDLSYRRGTMAGQRNYAMMDEEEVSDLLQKNPTEVLCSHDGREYVSTHFPSLAQRSGMSLTAFENFIIGQGMELIDSLQRYGRPTVP